MIISIIGSGALGKTYAGALALTGQEVHYLVRGEFEALKKEGRYWIEDEVALKTYEVDVPYLHHDPATLPASDIVIIALKTTQNDQLASLLTHCLKENSIVLIIQNGLGNENKIAPLLQRASIVSGISTICAVRETPTLVKIPFMGELRLAPYRFTDKHSCQLLKDLFKKSPMFFGVKIFAHHQEIRWNKLFWNISFGPLSILFNKPTRLLVTEEPCNSILRQAIDEVVNIAQADGVVISKDLIEKTLASTKNMKDYFPSMYQDFHNNLPIEKDYILDEALRIAKKKKVNAPILTLIDMQLSMLLEQRAVHC